MKGITRRWRRQRQAMERPAGRWFPRYEQMVTRHRAFAVPASRFVLSPGYEVRVLRRSMTGGGKGLRDTHAPQRDHLLGSPEFMKAAGVARDLDHHVGRVGPQPTPRH